MPFWCQLGGYCATEALLESGIRVWMDGFGTGGDVFCVTILQMTLCPNPMTFVRKRRDA
jgi:hypothetical protein